MVKFRKLKKGILKIWKDSVLSNVIAVGIVTLIGISWAKITNHSWKEIYDFILNVLSFEVPIYLFLSFVGIYFIVKVFFRLFRKRKNPIWDAQMGNYTFKELHNVLLTETFPVTTMRMQMSGMPAPTDNLLFLFQTYYTYLNKGIDFDDKIDDRGYLYNVLAPRLVGFGLVETYQKPLNDLPNRTEVAYKTSELGHAFHAALDKAYLPEKIKELKAKMK